MGASRNLSAGRYYHIYNRGNRKQNICLNEADYNAYIRIMFKHFRKQNQTILAYCFMPNHYHVLVRIEDTKAFVAAMRHFGSSSAIYFNKRYKTVGHLFQSRYKHREIANELDLIYVSRYIHRNPLLPSKSNLKKLISYPYSSFAEYCKPNTNNEWLLINKDILDYFQSQNAYKRFVLTDTYSRHMSAIKLKNLFMTQALASADYSAEY